MEYKVIELASERTSTDLKEKQAALKKLACNKEGPLLLPIICLQGKEPQTLATKQKNIRPYRPSSCIFHHSSPLIGLILFNSNIPV